MKEENIKKFEEIIKKSFLINKYLENYLKEDIEQIIDDYELDLEEMSDDEVPHIIGYYLKNNDTIIVTINFFDECSETGIGLETKEININDFLEWLKDN